MFKKRKPEEIGGQPASTFGTAADLRHTPLGVPPFRPPPPPEPSRSLPTQEPSMGRAPLSPPPPPPAPPSAAPRAGTAIPPGPVAAPRGPAERRTLVVGRGISVQGAVQEAERLVVEGTVEAALIQASDLQVAPNGMFRGEAQVTDAEIAGTVDGTVTALGALVIRSTGRLIGSAKCRRLQVEDGGQVSGRLEMLTEEVPPAALPTDPLRPAPEMPEPMLAPPPEPTAVG